MEIYFYIYFFLLFLALKEKKSIENKNQGAFIFTLLGVFLAIRYQVGNDYAEYYVIFNQISEGTYDSYFEPGFVFFYKLFDSPELFLAVLSITSVFILYRVFNYFSTNHFYVSLFLYYSVFLIIFNIHLIRQGVAIAIILLSFTYLHQKKYIKFVLLVLLAANFHKSALIALPFAFVIGLELTKNTRLIIFGIAIFSYLVFTFFKSEFFAVLSIIPITRRFASVYNNLRYSSGYGISMGLLFDVALFLFLNTRKNLNDKQLFLLNIFLCSIFISIAFNSFNVALRLGYYFRMVSVFLFVSLINVRPKLVFYMFLILYSGYYLHNNLYKGNAVLEYQTIFNKEK